jgi:thiol-disulfide isomerase/thioredoxin
LKRILLLGCVAVLIFAAPRVRARLMGPGEGVTPISAVDAANAIKASTGRPTVVLLYATTCPISRAMFPEFAEFSRRAQDAGAQVLAFSTDELVDAHKVPAFLALHGAQVAPYWIRPWARGELNAAFAGTGILVGTPWTRPLLAVRAADGHILYETQGSQEVAAAEASLMRALKVAR